MAPTNPRTWRRALAGALAAALFIAACGDDDGGGDADDGSADTEVADSEAAADTEAPADDEAPADADTEAPAETDDPDSDAGDDAGTGQELALEGQVEIAAGTTLDLDECPDDWDPFHGADGDEIRIGMSLPQSGQAAAFGALGEGIDLYFEYLNENDPIADKELVLIQKDDAYEAGRTVANVEEMLDVDDVFAFVHTIGTPNSLAIRPVTDEDCVPQLFNSSGFPLWGDPANWPWTIGNILNYETETQIWCQDIVGEAGEGASVSALIMNNDFGKTYEGALEQCEADGQIELAEVQVHDPAAPDVSNEMTTIIASDADVFVAGTTGAFCPQTVATVAASDWRPVFYMSYTCQSLASFFEPVREQAALLAEDGVGVRLVNSNKVCGDPEYDDDPAMQQVVQILDEYGGQTCADGQQSTGILYGMIVEDVLRAAAAMPGGVNRVNLMAATWNLDSSNDLLLGGSLRTDGVNDAYVLEAGEVQEVVEVDGTLTYARIGELVDLEGEAGSYDGG